MVPINVFLPDVVLAIFINVPVTREAIGDAKPVG
jgi:hypothetical protein